MKRTRKVLVGVGILGVVAVAGVWTCSYFSRPPARVLFDNVQFGMRPEEVERVIPDEPTCESERRLGPALWHGLIDGQVRRVRGHFSSDDLPSHPILRRSRLNKQNGHWELQE